MIVKMRKITFIGLQAEKERFIERLQEAGVTHLILPQNPDEPHEAIRDLQKVTEARKFLAKLDPGTQDPQTARDYKELCTRRDKLSRLEQQMQADLTVLKKEKSSLAVWGDFAREDLEILRSKGLTLHFYITSRKIFNDLLKEKEGVYIHIARETEGTIAFVIFSTRPFEFAFAEEKLPAKRLSEVEKEILARENALTHIKADYVALAGQIETLKSAELVLTDNVAYQRALLNTRVELDDRIFVLQCWSLIPETELMQKIGRAFTVYYEAKDPQAGDKVPVLLKNKPAFAPGQDLVAIYDQPNYTSFDPSGWVFYCFAIFFGMIIGDAGYGTVLLALSFWLHRKFKHHPNPALKRLFHMSYLLSASVIFFGIISVSYFGVLIPSESFLNKTLLLDFNTKQGKNDIMVLTIIIGMIHVSLSMAIKLFRSRDFASLGWIIVIWSGYALIQSKMGKGLDNPTALWAMIAGFFLILFFTSNHKNFLIRIASGLNGMMGVIQVFSDVLSYLRIFALGLATVYMCQTFNMLGEMAYKSVPWVGVILAALILALGHGINFLLGIMGGVVHGLRLNFLEWYRWSFEGDGLPYKPFQKSLKQI